MQCNAAAYQFECGWERIAATQGEKNSRAIGPKWRWNALVSIAVPSDIAKGTTISKCSIFLAGRQSNHLREELAGSIIKAVVNRLLGNRLSLPAFLAHWTSFHLGEINWCLLFLGHQEGTVQWDWTVDLGIHQRRFGLQMLLQRRPSPSLLFSLHKQLHCLNGLINSAFRTNGTKRVHFFHHCSLSHGDVVFLHP